MKVYDICTTDVVTARVDDSIRTVAQRMREHHVGDVVVVDDQDGRLRPIGMLTDRDIVVSLIAEGSTEFDQARTGETMSEALLIAHRDEDVDQVLKQMSQRGVRRVPVIDDDEELVGILSLDDCIEFMHRRLELLADVVHTEIQHETDRDTPDATLH